jgi:hypothetical protein
LEFSQVVRWHGSVVSGQGAAQSDLGMHLEHNCCCGLHGSADTAVVSHSLCSLLGCYSSFTQAELPTGCDATLAALLCRSGCGSS